jgi:hypothetical protein
MKKKGVLFEKRTKNFLSLMNESFLLLFFKKEVLASLATP